MADFEQDTYNQENNEEHDEEEQTDVTQTEDDYADGDDITDDQERHGGNHTSFELLHSKDEVLKYTEDVESQANNNNYLPMEVGEFDNEGNLQEEEGVEATEYSENEDDGYLNEVNTAEVQQADASSDPDENKNETFLDTSTSESVDKNVNKKNEQYSKLRQDIAQDGSNSNADQMAADYEEGSFSEPVERTQGLTAPEMHLIKPSSLYLEELETTVNLNATATVKFMLVPSGQVVTLACTLGQTLELLKSHFASELKMPASAIMLMFNGAPMPDNTILAQLGVGPNGTVQLEMQSVDPVNIPLKPYRSRQEYHMPDVITVRVMTEDCEAKDVVVEIERSRTKKPFLGGFRNKNTGVEFHNAAAQTIQKPRPPPTSERFCRDTQTCEQRNRHQQTNNDTSTQMTGIGVYISNLEDKLMPPGEYVTADDHWAMILSKVIILQKNLRRWLAQRYVKKLKEDKEKRLEWERLEELRKKKEKEERIQREYARRINPKTQADFDRLINCLEKWRMEEMERINSSLTGAERKAAMCMLLDQETELLSAIERHKNEANSDNQITRIMNFLEKAAAPKMWQAHDGKLTYMDTPFTIRAKELRDIYNSINMKYLTQDERLDVLLTLKHTVKEHDCKLTQEIIELIDREADLLMRGVKETNLAGLRKRICTLFLQYIKTPTFNPEAAKYLKVPQDPMTLRKNINYCRSCGSYLPSTDFFITTNSKNAGRCRRCQKIENEGHQRADHTYFKVMLKALHKSEEAMQDGSTLCFLLQENDLRYLVENIWSNQSVLSAWNDPYDLVLCRWDKHQEWSPWNCILLTHDEAEAHKKLFSLEEGYGHVFIHKVTQKHNFARNYFSRLPGMAEAMRKKMLPKDIKKKDAPATLTLPASKVQKV
ncbi:hypothetical protein BsWGS_13962 [Bradybaena similaris]